MIPHKHAEVIKAWADGATIEYWSRRHECWMPVVDNVPSWWVNEQYRVKPNKIVLDRYLHVSELNYLLANSFDAPNCRMTFDPVTRSLIDVEMIK